MSRNSTSKDEDSYPSLHKIIFYLLLTEKPFELNLAQVVYRFALKFHLLLIECITTRNVTNTAGTVHCYNKYCN